MQQDLVPKGIEPICGWEWIAQHQHDLDGWHPTFEVSTGTIRHTMHIKDLKILSEVVKSVCK